MAEHSFGGPYVQVAAICMTPLVEQQGLLSVIRIQDRVNIAGITDEMKPQPLHGLQLVISLKAGEMRGKSKLKITPIAPSGKSLPFAEAPVLFEGEERGCVLAIPLGVVAEEEGLYWLDITVEGTLLTRVPLRVMYQKIPNLPGMQFPGSKTD